MIIQWCLKLNLFEPYEAKDSWINNNGETIVIKLKIRFKIGFIYINMPKLFLDQEYSLL